MYLNVENINKSYGKHDNYTRVLNDVSFQLEEGKMCVIQGSSGSGKSTLLNCIGGLDKCDSGNITIDGREITSLKPGKLLAYRRDTLGFIFQFYNLVPNLTVRENIEVCRYLSKDPLDVNELMKTLGIADQAHKFPSQLSGGQQQRTAIARSLVKNPKLLLCDEPTGALDSVTSKEILILLEEVNRRYGTTMLIVTHNNAIKNMVHKVIYLKDGSIVREYENETLIPARELEDL